MSLLDLLGGILLELFNQLLDISDSGTRIWHGRSLQWVVVEGLDGAGWRKFGKRFLDNL
jgi:hypothetical protein